MSSIVSRRPPPCGSTSHVNDRRWISIRLGTSRGFCRRANVRRTRVVSAAAKAATPQRVENEQIERSATPTWAGQSATNQDSTAKCCPCQGRSTLTDPARAPAYVARAPDLGGYDYRSTAA